MSGSQLGEKLQQLIDQHHELKQEKLEMGRLIEMQQTRLAEQEDTIASLRKRIDEMDRDRFSVKQLKDERRQIRRKLETAMTRLDHIEQELS